MPKARPLAIEKVSGMVIRVRNAGMAMTGSSQSISVSGPIIIAPTRISAGAVAAAGITCSMSRRGNCYDNAVMEAFFSTLKTELAEVVVAAIEPIRNRAEDLLSDPAELDRLLARGAEKANELAEKTLATVYERIGFVTAK